MPKRFPRTVVVTLKPNDEYRFYFDVLSFRDNVSDLLRRGLTKMDIVDLVIPPISIEFETVFHHFYKRNTHLACATFTSETVAGNIEIKYHETSRQGQIEFIKLIITKCEVPKVVFT